MPRLQAVTDNAPEPTEDTTTTDYGLTVVELEDYSKKVSVPDALFKGGLDIVFRDPTHADFEKLAASRAGGNEIEAIKKFGCTICTSWGDKPGITPPQWDKLRVKLSLALMDVLNSFF